MARIDPLGYGGTRNKGERDFSVTSAPGMADESYIIDCLTIEVGLRTESADLHLYITLALEWRKKNKQKGDPPKLVTTRASSSLRSRGEPQTWIVGYPRTTHCSTEFAVQSIYKPNCTKDLGQSAPSPPPAKAK